MLHGIEHKHAMSWVDDNHVMHSIQNQRVMHCMEDKALSTRQASDVKTAALGSQHADKHMMHWMEDKHVVHSIQDKHVMHIGRRPASKHVMYRQQLCASPA